MISRYAIYGLIGWCTEVVWTGLGSAFQGDWRLVSRTYIWMFFIYGLAVFLEPLHEQIRSFSWVVRGIIWAAAILCIEYVTGYLLGLVVGRCPWDYSGATLFTVPGGYIRWDYAPVWFGAGLLWEQVHDYLKKIRV